MKPPIEASGIKFFWDSQGELFVSFIGGADGRDFLKLFCRCWQKWARGDYAGIIYAGQVDDKGTCRQSSKETNTSPGQPPALRAELAEACGMAAAGSPPATPPESMAGDGEPLPATPISGKDAETIQAMIAAYEAMTQQQAAQIASLQAQLEAISAILRQVSLIEAELADIHAERAGAENILNKPIEARTNGERRGHGDIQARAASEQLGKPATIPAAAGDGAQGRFTVLQGAASA